MLETLMGMNDSLGSRVDAEDLGIREEIWLQPSHRQHGEYYMPHAPYVLKANERTKFVAIISNIRTPTNYVGSIHKRLADGKLQYMKTHDYHVLMQQVSKDGMFSMCPLQFCFNDCNVWRMAECLAKRTMPVYDVAGNMHSEQYGRKACST
jgi:hypothetical protein